MGIVATAGRAAGLDLTQKFARAKQGADFYSRVYYVLLYAQWWRLGVKDQDEIVFFNKSVRLPESISPQNQADEKETMNHQIT